MSDQSIPRHGRTQFYIEGEGLTPDAMPSPRLRALVPAAAAAFSSAPPVDEKRAFRFCRLFPAGEQPNDAGLIDLGQSLADPFVAGSGDSLIPAGFTYLGQFVDHDITRDLTEGIPTGSLNPDEIENGRSPSLELDSLYGRGPEKSPELYDADQVHLKIGQTTGRPDFDVTHSLPNDLPRRPDDGTEERKRAIIGDHRNDENLIVAQTHLAFLKFHNKVVDRLQGEGVAAGDLFKEARKRVIQHYQSLVLHDFVKRLVDPAVFQDILAYGRKVYFPKGVPKGGYLCMPVEFSVAAFRLGHSMIRNAYQWNRVFSAGGVANLVPRLTLFFEFSRLAPGSDLGGEPTLPTDWVADWRRMYDFSEQPGGVRHPQMNVTRQIDTRLADGLTDLPEFANALEEHLKFLAVRNLLRGRLVSLPTGQDAAAALGVAALTPAEVASGPQAAVIMAHGFDTKTPLWFYILKEAELKQGGQRLGEVGSRILMETFHGLVEGSEYSILKQKGWTPSLPAQDPNRFTMNDLLRFVDDVNPLGD